MSSNVISAERAASRPALVQDRVSTVRTRTADCCVVGAGPGGMMLALLLARQGLDVALLEAHGTFDRDFRGDGVHPATLELLDQLGLVDRLLASAHAPSTDFPIHLPDGRLVTPNRPALSTRFPDTVSLPQTEFLELLADAAHQYPSFHLTTGARVEHLVEQDGVIRGVRYRTRDGWDEVWAPLVVGADGRFSKVRQLAGFSIIGTPQEIDVLQLRLPRSPTDPPRAYGLYPSKGELLVVSERGDQWQISFAFPKGGYQELRRAGLGALNARITRLAPWLADRASQLQDWHQTSLLVVQAGRVRRWYRPGLLLIGDAAHVMTPIFGVGINYAIQDAVVAANVLGPRLRQGRVGTRDLAAVQRRREWPTRLMQFLQEVEKNEEFAMSGPLAVRAASKLIKLSPLRSLRGRLIAFGGFRPERALDG